MKTMQQMRDGEKSADFPADELTPEQQERESRRLREDQLSLFGLTLALQRDEWVAARAASGWDKRVREDIDQFEGRDIAHLMAANMMTSVEQGYPVTTNHARATRSTVFINLTRPKTNSAEARLVDIVLPTDEENWSIEPTPNPKIIGALESDAPAVDPANGQPIVNPETGVATPQREIALAAKRLCEERSKGMADEIKDQLIECDYKAEVRKVIHNACKLGVGVLKGPIVHGRTRKAWVPVQGATYELKVEQVKTPASWSVDPRNVWEDPACGDDIQKGRGIYELDRMTSKQVRQLAQQPGYIPEAIAKVLQQAPSVSTVHGTPHDKRENLSLSNRPYEVWTYTGEIDREDFKAAQQLGVGYEEPDGEEMTTDEEDEILSSVSAVIVVINSIVVKAYLNPNESGELPYDFFPYELEIDSPRGVGVPYLMRAQQKVVNAGWRMMMDNGGMAVGPQIILKRGQIRPADGNYEIAARKIWYATDEVEDVTKAFTTVEFEMHQPELAALIEMAERLIDTETGTPQLTQGEQGNAPDTLGGMQMLMNNTNVVTRRLVKQFDDKLTKPHIRRYYDFNMAYSEKENIKGDMDVDARGSSALLVRDIQNQAFTNLLAAGGNPVYAPFIDAKKLFENALKAQHVKPSDVMKSDEQIAAEAEAAKNAPQPQDPRIASATIMAQARVHESDNRAATQREALQTNLQETQLDRDLALIKLAQESKLSFDEIKAALAETAMKIRSQRDLAANETKLRVTTGEGI